MDKTMKNCVLCTFLVVVSRAQLLLQESSSDIVCNLSGDASPFSHMYSYYSLLARVAAASDNSSEETQRIASAGALDLLRYDAVQVKRELDEWLAVCWLPSIDYRAGNAGDVNKIFVGLIYRSENDRIDERRSLMFPAPRNRVFICA